MAVTICERLALLLASVVRQMPQSFLKLKSILMGIRLLPGSFPRPCDRTLCELRVFTLSPRQEKPLYEASLSMRSFQIAA